MFSSNFFPTVIPGLIFYLSLSFLLFHLFAFLLFFFFLWPHHTAFRIKVRQPWIEPGSQQWKCQLLTWTTREFPLSDFLSGRSPFNQFFYFFTLFLIGKRLQCCIGYTVKSYTYITSSWPPLCPVSFYFFFPFLISQFQFHSLTPLNNILFFSGFNSVSLRDINHRCGCGFVLLLLEFSSLLYGFRFTQVSSFLLVLLYLMLEALVCGCWLIFMSGGLQIWQDALNAWVGYINCGLCCRMICLGHFTGKSLMSKCLGLSLSLINFS